ncbi:dioxygenase domain protein (macronuclear) [Tetrahymena thermophila SB210]|uniref:Dioxygenase domain protein n=1 Tax=Tetrahymena thermophila (strain SB210) TaxID=312017 RepID=Q22MV3_TETTS|nr:dioxygenase domain protein [Tetrahymena thermophila SB210]EAR86597.1 dioxygenase domain protein [Tetrahymena thermophila SB210]|eukprot:XP_976917.1 dioxygenase domain protein [Tetrahymena thermophila SB210]
MIRKTINSIASQFSYKNVFFFTKRKEGFQIIDYHELTTSESGELFTKFQRSFGRDGIGSVLVRNIPHLSETRFKLLPLTYQLANMPNEELEKLVKAETHYLRGWSQKNQKVYGVENKNLGIFRAHILKDDKYQWSVSQLEHLPKRIQHLVGDNVWPDSNPSLNKIYKKQFLDYHQIVYKTAIILLTKLEKFIENEQPHFRTSALTQLLKRSDQHIGGQFYSYPNCSYEQLTQDWAYWSTDYSLLQGLSSQIYVNSLGETQDYVDHDSGLHIFSQDPNNYIKIRLDDNSILFKAGEALQILSGGVIYPKPHRLIRGSFIAGKDLSVDYLNTVIQPNLEEKLSVPAGVKVDDVLDEFSASVVPDLSERWQQSTTYGQFVEKTLLSYQARK